ncbi:hypothetical protein [Sandarakinorhabdus sp.]|uniref:hypothetical protein n=1 Tax=Sandarakinorhabdus sp. TaxID=1916663 RepID=UPI00333E65E0
MTMGKYGSVLALVIGFVLAMGMHGANRVEAPRTGPALPELARSAAGAGVTIGDAWPASADLAGLQTGCAEACTRSDYRPLAPWEAQPPLPQVAGDLRLTWPGRQDGSQRLQSGTAPPAALARLQATPMQFATEPLAMPARASSLSDGPWLNLAPTPEPQSWALFITGMLMVGRQLRRRKSAYLATL